MAKRPEKKGGVNLNVPGRPVGRLIDTLTDLIRPISEARGLKADMIRLQREEVAIEIAKRTREKLAAAKAEIKPVPTKVLVPLLEAASTEDINDEVMIEAWSNLLASAAKEGGTEPRFVGILKELRGKQAKLLEDIALNNWQGFEQARTALLNSSTDLRMVQAQEKLRWVVAQTADIVEIQETLLDHFNRPGCYIGDIFQFSGDETISMEVGEPRPILDLEILESVGLCRHVTMMLHVSTLQSVHVYYHHITDLGLAFLAECNPSIFDDAKAVNPVGPGVKAGYP